MKNNPPLYTGGWGGLADPPCIRAVGVGEAGEASASPLFSHGHAHMGSLLLDLSILLSSLPIKTW